MPFKFTKLSISDVVLIEPQIFEDERGFFLENFKEVAPTLKRLYVTGGEPSIIEANTKIIKENKKC